MTEAVPTGFGVEPSASVRAVLNANGLAIDSDRTALDAMAADFGRIVPEQPRVVLLHDNEIAHSDEATILVVGDDDAIGMRKLHAPTVHEGDYLVRVPHNRVPESAVVSAGLARIFRREQRWRQNLIMARTGAGLIVTGLVESGVAYVGMHSDKWDNVGFAMFGIGLGLVTYAYNRDPYGKPPKISHLEHPVQIVPKRHQQDELPDAPGKTIPGHVVRELPPSETA